MISEAINYVRPSSTIVSYVTGKIVSLPNIEIVSLPNIENEGKVGMKLRYLKKARRINLMIN